MKTLPWAVAACGALFAFAFVAAPKSCEWGNTAYFWLGVAVLLAMFTTPLFLETGRKPGMRFLIGCGYAAATIAIWLGGLTAANIQIMCRLF